MVAPVEREGYYYKAMDSAKILQLFNNEEDNVLWSVSECSHAQRGAHLMDGQIEQSKSGLIHLNVVKQHQRKICIPTTDRSSICMHH